MLMAGNYDNIDLANKMECISTREYLLPTSKITVHHLVQKYWFYQWFQKGMFAGCSLNSI